jgi:hypothetical protein
MKVKGSVTHSSGSAEKTGILRAATTREDDRKAFAQVARITAIVMSLPNHHTGLAGC